LAVPAAIALYIAVGAVGCKGETKYKDKPETLDALKNCQSQRDEKDKYIKELEKRLADLEFKGGDAGEVVVTITGDEIKIDGKGPNERAAPGEPAGNAKDAELYEAFIDLVNKSRGSIKKCYQNALKKNTALQARTISLKLQASFSSSGAITSSSFSPEISDAFDQCMKSITAKWKLPAAPKAMKFTAPLTLTPT
jgi:hypothetical protein